MRFYVGSKWAPHMALRGILQQDSVWYPHVPTHMGHTWEQYVSHSKFGPNDPCPANLCRINNWFQTVHFCVIECFNSFHKAVEKVTCAELHKGSVSSSPIPIWDPFHNEWLSKSIINHYFMYSIFFINVIMSPGQILSH